ncbi:hypothetical protein A2881_05180 [Candidatus Peribacteria bacterium RIFCSPHIGHO2_01_FULL_55_13]|nr:MAG: hypothetical protein A2881_05180 [Candidatus Peribacteria bacterium RIFCSPHIGHO2_01_FULL_55_13]OGJ66472.1 MAG: hypothetical protein A3F36_01735 [Candidatus Peribacteria bacterium RIFCSPHIGHO2_12_FULL_55_11]
MPDAPMPAETHTTSGSLGAPEADRGAMRTRLMWSLPFACAFLPIVLLGVYSYQVAAGSVNDLINAEHLTATNNLADLITQDMNRSVQLTRALASVPLTVQAVEERNIYTISARLKAVVVAYPNIDHAYVTDQTGKLWAEFPTSSGSYGMDLSGEQWFSAVEQTRDPFVGDVELRKNVYREEPVVIVAAPIQSHTGAFLGAMVFEYHADQITKWLQNVRIAHGGYLFVVDDTGTLLAHPTYDFKEGLFRDLASDPAFTRALAGELHTSEYIDPFTHQRMVATFLPVAVGGSRWVIVAQQPAELAFAELKTVRLNITVASASLSLVTLLLVVALAHMSVKNIRLNKDLQSKNTTLRDITSFVSHQLRAPVTALRWSLESLMDGDSGDMSGNVRREIEKIYKVVIQNGALINDILNVSRLDRGVIEVKLAPASLAEIAERAIRDYLVPAEKAGLKLSIEHLDQSIMVTADAEKLAEAVSNAVSNAIKHTKTGDITLALRSDEKFGYIDVTDTGEGMSPEILAHLFDRTGVKGSNTDSAQSAGLGLFIARQFTRLMGGDVTVKAEEGKGSVFTYSVPLALSN